MEKWNKLATGYAFVSASMTAVARSRFDDYRMRDGDTIAQTQHRFDQLVTECIIQALAISEEVKTLVLLTHPTDKFIWYTPPAPPRSA